MLEGDILVRSGTVEFEVAAGDLKGWSYEEHSDVPERTISLTRADAWPPKFKKGARVRLRFHYVVHYEVVGYVLRRRLNQIVISGWLIEIP